MLCCSSQANPRNLVDIPGSNSYRLNPVLSGEVSELVEGARLETVYGVFVIEGSNPSLSAIAGR
jgi:hypothetical protein